MWACRQGLDAAEDEIRAAVTAVNAVRAEAGLPPTVEPRVKVHAEPGAIDHGDGARQAIARAWQLAGNKVARPAEVVAKIRHELADAGDVYARADQWAAGAEERREAMRRVQAERERQAEVAARTAAGPGTPDHWPHTVDKDAAGNALRPYERGERRGPWDAYGAPWASR